MTAIQTAAIQGLWMAAFRFTTQLISWSSTIIIARLLVPDDYGLMAMATIFTGYAMMFSQLGLGAAIIQKSYLSRQQLSSIFWFIIILGIFLSILCFILAYPTSYVFNEPRLVPITSTVSILFILNSTCVVPLNILKKNLLFKLVGFIEMTAIIISVIFMIIIAYMGGGVWTLIGGQIIQSLVKSILLYSIPEWKPSFYFRFNDVRESLNFGIIVVFASSFLYIFEKSDVFFGAKYWEADLVGLYTFAILLSRIPNDKITSLIKQVSFPILSMHQNNMNELVNIYLNIGKFIIILIMPLFIGGYLLGDQLIYILFNEKWYPIIPLFKILCLSQIFLNLSVINDCVNTSLGKPSWAMYFYGSCAILMSISFFIAAKGGIYTMMIPWISVFPVICTIFMIATLKKLEIRIKFFIIKNIHPIIATIIMALTVIVIKNVIFYYKFDYYINKSFFLIFEILIGALSYITYLIVFDREFINNSYNLVFKKKNNPVL